MKKYNTKSRKAPADSENLFIVEGVAGIWHYHLSESGMSGHPALCGKTEVMSTEVPLSAWGVKSHLSETYCEECEKIWKSGVTK